MRLSRRSLLPWAVVLAGLAAGAAPVHADGDEAWRQAGSAGLEGRWHDARASGADEAWAWRPWVEVDAGGAVRRAPGEAAYAPPPGTQVPAEPGLRVGDLRARIAGAGPALDPTHPRALLDRLWRDRLWREARGMAQLPSESPLQDLKADEQVAYQLSVQDYVFRPPPPEQHPDTAYAAEQGRRRQAAEDLREQSQALAGAGAAVLLVLGLWTGLRLRPKA